MQIQRTDACDGQCRPREGAPQWSADMQGILIRMEDTIPFHFRHLSLLEYADVKKYVWHMLEGDFSYIENSKNERIQIRPGVYSGPVLEQIMGMDYGINRLQLRAYPLGERISAPKGGAHPDNDCFLVLLVMDYRHIEIYCRDEEFIRRTAEKCRRTPEVELIETATGDSEGLSGFYIW